MTSRRDFLPLGRVDYSLTGAAASIAGTTTRVAWYALLAVVASFASAAPIWAQAVSSGSAPETRRSDFVEVVHGVELADPYRWLEEEQSPETRAWVEAQNTFALSILNGLPSLPRVQQRLLEQFAVEQVGSPSVVGDKLYYEKRLEGEERFSIYERDGLFGAERRILDPADVSSDLSVSVELRGFQGSGRYMVYVVREGGEDETEIRIRDMEGGEDLPDYLPRGFNGSPSFNSDFSGFLYGRSDKQTGGRVYYHELGTPMSEDEVVFGEGRGPLQRVNVRTLGSDDRMLATVGHGWARTDVYLKDGAGAQWRPLIEGIDALFSVYPQGDRFWLLTDHEAPNYRLVEMDPARPEPENWRDVLAERDDVLQGISFAGGRLFGRYIHNAAVQIRMHELDGTFVRELELPGAGNASLPYSAGVDGLVFFEFESFTQPRTIYLYDLATTERRVWHETERTIDTSDFEVKQEWFESKDGVRVPMYIVHRAGLRMDGDSPTLLVGYGGFNGVRLPSYMSGSAFWMQQDGALWVEQGGVYAVANIRGGNEFGRTWHRSGMLEFKQNVFNDFIGAAEHLIDREYTRPERLAIQGASNGGLLVGAAMTQRPDLFQAVLCDLADLDMIGQPRFGKNNPPALLEYGDSREPDQFEFLLRWSPYHNVEAGTEYPAVLFTGGDMDSRVEPAQTRKMTALVQWATTSDRPVIVEYHTRVGHGGWWGRGLPMTERSNQFARQIAFLNWQLGVPEPPR